MAEIVQKNCESMIRELESLRQTKLFSEPEIRRILKERRRLESKINNKSKDVNDYKSYIIQETLILKRIGRLRKKQKITEKKKWVDNRIILRIRRLYQTALLRFPSEYSLHIDAFQFCKNHELHAPASQIVDNMIKMFSGVPEAWSLAAEWYHTLKDLNRAIQTVQKGLTFNPQSVLLYKKGIYFEIDKINEADHEEKSKVQSKCIDFIKIYVQLLLKNVKDVEQIISTLEILEKFDFTSPAQQLILDHLVVNNSEEAITWHKLATRERKGLHFVTDPEESSDSDNLLKNCVIFCINKYEQGLSTVSAEERKKLWSYYLKTLSELSEEKWGFEDLNCVELLKEAFKKAHSQKCLEENHYKVWLEMIPDEEGKLIFEEAAREFQNSIDFWKTQLNVAIEKKKDIENVFERGVSSLKDKSLPLWLLMLKYLCLDEKSEEMREYLEKGVQQPFEISDALKPKYIEWIAFNDGIEAARAKYRILALEKPYCKDLHSVMVKLERSQSNIDNESLQAVHELACSQFGRENIQVWLDNLKFLLLRKPDDLMSRIDKIKNRAKVSLPEQLWSQFDKMYRKLLVEVE